MLGPDVLVTAGHCVTNQSQCENFSWIFDYTNDVTAISVDNVYKCSAIIDRELTQGGNDFAVLRLDRPVVGRTPLEYRQEGAPVVSTTLAVIGHPSGLPLKIDAGGFIRNISNVNYIEAELDTFGGNSGSPVFNLDTGEVEGILVRGETDYERDFANSCNIPKVCATGTCMGEHVQRITLVRGINTPAQLEVEINPLAANF